MGMSGAALGVAYIEIRPETSGFQAAVASSVAGAAGSGINVPAKVDEQALGAQAKTVFSDLGNSAGSWFSDNFKQLLKTAGLFVGMAEAYNILKESVSGAVSLETQQRQTNIVFGQGAGAVQAFADTSVTALGQSKEAALQATNQFGLMLTGFGVAQSAATTMAPQVVAAIAKISSATGASFSDVQGAVDSALRGRATALKDYGVVVNTTTLQQKALADGLIKPAKDQDAIAIAAANVDTLRKSLQGAAPDSAALESAQLRLTAAQRSQAATLEKFPATSAQAATAAKSVFDAQTALGKLQAPGSALDPAQRAGDQAKLNDAVEAYNKLLAGSLPPLTAAQTATETLALIQQQVANDPAFGGTAADKFAIVGAAIDNAKTALGQGLLPYLKEFSTWVAAHTADIERAGAAIGQGLGTAITDIGTAVGFIVQHQTVFADLALAIGGMFVASKVRDWTNEVKKAGDGITGLIGKVLGFGTPATPAGKALSATMEVGEMTVGTLIAKSMVGGPGLTGEPVPTGGEPVPVPSGGTVGTVGKVAGTLAPFLFRSPALAAATLGMVLSGDKAAGGQSNLPDPTAVTKDLTTMTPGQILAGWKDSTSAAFKDLEAGLKGPGGLALIAQVDTDIQQLPAKQQAPLLAAFNSAVDASGIKTGLPAIVALLAAIATGVPVASATGASGRVVGTGGAPVQINPGAAAPTTVVHVYNPASNVDVVTAMAQANYHTQVADNRGTLPASQWPANLSLANQRT